MKPVTLTVTIQTQTLICDRPEHTGVKGHVLSSIHWLIYWRDVNSSKNLSAVIENPERASPEQLCPHRDNVFPFVELNKTFLHCHHTFMFERQLCSFPPKPTAPKHRELTSSRMFDLQPGHPATPVAAASAGQLSWGLQLPSLWMHFQCTASTPPGPVTELQNYREQKHVRCNSSSHSWSQMLQLSTDESATDVTLRPHLHLLRSLVPDRCVCLCVCVWTQFPQMSCSFR